MSERDKTEADMCISLCINKQQCLNVNIPLLHEQTQPVDRGWFQLRKEHYQAELKPGDVWAA